MLVKYLSMVTILICSTILGFYLSKLEGYRLKDLMNIKKMAMMLATEIEYSASLALALEQISSRIEGPVSLWIMDASKELSKRVGIPFLDIWSNTLNTYKGQTYLNNEDIQYIIDFGKNLGYLDKSMQHKNIKLFVNYIDEEMNVINQQKEKTSKMYRSLGFLLGLLVIIVLM